MPHLLKIVATPIGNLQDISERALSSLKSADLIVCEDTRVTSKLLAAYKIQKPLKSLHQHTNEKQIQSILNELMSGKDIVYVSDAGTPGVNDPGGKLVAAAHKERLIVSPIPGPSALTAAISVCGFPMEQFSYLGFAPTKKGRQSFFKDVMTRDQATIFFESTHRLIKALEQMYETVRGTTYEVRMICVSRELTKIYETIYRGTAEQVLIDVQQSSAKGESVIIVAPKKYQE